MELPLAQMPTIDASFLLALISRVLHILSAVILVGGIAYLRKVVVPGLSAAEDPGTALYAGRRSAWAKWVGVATALLLVTGFYNFFSIMGMYPELPSLYHMLFGIKFLLALALFFFAALLAGKTSTADRLRQRSKRWLTICLALGILVIIIASVMRSLHLPVAVGEPAAAPPAAVGE